MSKYKNELAGLLTKAHKFFPEKEASGMRKMLDVISDNIVKDDIEFFDENILAEMAKTHWEMSKGRKEGEPDLRIYCPVTEEGECRKTVIDIVSDDLAFLVDSVVAEINQNNTLIGILVHPYAYVLYDNNGTLKDIKTKDAIGYQRQAHIHVQINETLSNDAIQALHEGLIIALKDVFYINNDWQKMLAKMKDASKELDSARTNRPSVEMREHCAFLDYLCNDNYTLLGYREYNFVEGKDGLKSETVEGTSLGLLQDGVTPAYTNEVEESLSQELQELRRSLPPVSISKTNRLSLVHRRVPMDCVAVKTYDDKGVVVGEKLFMGLFTSVTYSRSVGDVPHLRVKVDETIELSGYFRGAHDSRAIRHILEKYPRDELFQIGKVELLGICKSIIRLQERQRIAMFMRKDPFGRYVSCLVYIPRDRFSTQLRVDIQGILEEETCGVCSNFYTTLDDSVFARVMYVINVSQKNPQKINANRIEDRLREAGQTWSERLTQALADACYDDRRISYFNDRYAEAFPASYTFIYQARQCVYDIENIEQVFSKKRIVLDLYRPSGLEDTRIRLKIFHLERPVALSDVMPILENMGLHVISEIPFEVKPAGEDISLWIHDFLLETPEIEGAVIVNEVKKNFEKSFAKTWYNEVENDGLNRLVLAAGANWHEITILRAYVLYIRQLGLPFSRNYIGKALSENPNISRLLVNLFKAYHDPENGDRSDKLVKKCKADLDEELSMVTSGDYDRILRSIMVVVDATLRTNYYQRQDGGSAKQYLSLKFDSKQIPFMPLPKSYREVYVYSPRVEAVHLRGDKIARGGLRWSDRHEDYRTEVLGLMKAQMVKNAVIVPMGSKGGFIVKTPTSSREEYIEEGIACYKTFIRGLLDITDNRKGEEVISPSGVICRDGDDPYLVVAADKGTATFSDIANGISAEYDFWLGDAFASGGSVGYDHKKMGITARGAWESVKDHFFLLDHDTQTQPFDAIGVGDMGGDVFGNGMLLSEHIRLVGAFNHLHIFCDPAPDTKSTYIERKRLFDATSGWGEYNQDLLSKGGKIYNRSDKMLELTAQIKKRFDLSKDKVSPGELIVAMLKARTDLLWFGGIGTYIKATRESNADAGDKANDAIRISAKEVRARVIGEGANLGITQLGRVEMGEHGVSLNTDFIDNSAGVDTSDHEVNIKILLSDVIEQEEHKMDADVRKKLLGEMTDEIAEHVLIHNYQQAQAISMTERKASENLQEHDAYIQNMERTQGLSREIEGLPDHEAIEKRLREGKGLTRPELCVLLAYAKINLTKELLESDIPDNPKMNYWIMDYFPEVLGKRYEKEILRHRLKREIIATMMANSLVNRMGPTFLQSCMNKTAAGVKEVMQAYLIARDVFGLRHLWNAIETVESFIPSKIQLESLSEVVSLAEHGITWFLTRLGRDMDIDEDVIEFRAGVKDLSKNLDNLVTDSLKKSIKKRQDTAMENGIDEDMALNLALMPVLSSACDIIRIAKGQEHDIDHTARVYFELGERFHMDWMRQKANSLPRDNQWQTEASAGLMDQLYSSQAGMTLRILRDVGDKKDSLKKGQSLIDLWIAGHENHIDQIDELFADLKRVGKADLTMLTVAEKRLRGLYGG